MCAKLSLLVLALWHCQSLLLAQASKVTFIKSGQVYTSNIGATDVRQLTSVASNKQSPRWSPDGKRIVYRDIDASSTSLGTLVVIASDGSPVGTYPVARVTPNGVRIEGMRDIEKIGWFDDGDVFAIGSINPYIEEYRAINIQSRNIRAFGGFGFSTCPTRGIVAFWQALYPQQKTMSVLTSADRNPLFEFPNANDLPTTHIPLAWDSSCKSLALVDPTPPTHLVVILEADQERKIIDLPDISGVTPLRSAPGGFVLGKQWQLHYRLGNGSVEPTPTDITDKLKAESEARRRTVSALGAADADWWPGDEGP